MKLSLSMIVRNEERFLPGCLESVKGLVDEIVIIDTGSTDSTKEIAKKFGARMWDFKWCDDFSAARNESLKMTTGDWVLYLDADERIETSLHSKVRKLISSGKADAFLLNLKSRIGTKEDAQYHLVSYPRLFKKMKGVGFSGKVHEQITNSLTAVHARIVQTDVIIEHLGYAQDDDVIMEKARRNQRLLLSQMECRENYGYALYQLGQTEIILGEVDKGLGHLHEALAAGGFGKSVEASIHGIIGENMLKKGNMEAALAACEKSLAAAPHQTFANMLRGDTYLKLGNFAEAEKALMTAVKEYKSSILVGKTATAIEAVFEPDVLYSRLGKAANLAGDLETADAYLWEAAAGKKKPQRVAEYLEFLLKNNMRDKAIEMADSFREFEGEDWYLRLISSALIDAERYDDAARLLAKVSERDNVSWSLLAHCQMKTGDLDGADYSFQRATDLGYRDPQGLELHGLVQFKLGKFDEAARTLDKVIEVDPDNARARRFAQAARTQTTAQQQQTNRDS